jgi:hypothetical protein
MSEKYRITDNSTFNAVLGELQSQLFFPLRSLRPELYLYSVAQLHDDVCQSQELLNRTTKQIRIEKILLVSLSLLIIAFLLTLIANTEFEWLLGLDWFLGLGFGASLGNLIIHFCRLRHHQFVANEMVNLIPLLTRGIAIVTSCELQRLVIAKVEMEGASFKTNDYVISSPQGTIIVFQFK